MPGRGAELVRASGGRGWSARLAALLLPPACAACSEALPALSGVPARSGTVCPRCLTRLKAPPHPRCRRCQAPRGTGLPAGRECNECRFWPDALTSATSSVVLVPPADALVSALKYGGWRQVAGDMARRMVRALAEAGPGQSVGPAPRSSSPIVVPVPTTPGRLRRRGYNQARLLAVEVCARTGVGLAEALRRPEGGRSQVGLRPEARWMNVEGVFAVDAAGMARCIGEDVILVDDVLTTGATACAAARVLVAAGARSVRALTFARALPEFE